MGVPAKHGVPRLFPYFLFVFPYFLCLPRRRLFTTTAMKRCSFPRLFPHYLFLALDDFSQSYLSRVSAATLCPLVVTAANALWSALGELECSQQPHTKGRGAQKRTHRAGCSGTGCGLERPDPQLHILRLPAALPGLGLHSRSCMSTHRFSKQDKPWVRASLPCRRIRQTGDARQTIVHIHGCTL